MRRLRNYSPHACRRRRRSGIFNKIFKVTDKTQMKLVYVLCLSLFIFAATFGLEKIENGFAKRWYNPKKIEISVIDSEKANLLFKEFVQNKNIPFKYPRDGCYARATAMAMMAEKSSVIMGKAFATGLLVAKTNIPNYPYAVWGWHVAPVSYVKHIDGKIELMVFDPGLFSQPVSVNEWADKMKEDIGINGAKGQVDEIYFGSRFQYLERQEKTEHYKKKWEDEDLTDMSKKFSEYLPLQDYISSYDFNFQGPSMPQQQQQGAK